MSPRLSAKRRMAVGLQTVALAHDREGIQVDAVAEELGVDGEVVLDAVAPFTDLEYVDHAGSFVDDIGHIVTVTDGWIEARVNWTQDLTSLEPGDAALLLALIHAAEYIDGVSVEALRGLRRRLTAIAYVSVQEAVPPAVASLLSAKHAGVVISAKSEGSDMRVGGEPGLYEVHDVRWTKHGWRAVITTYGEAEARTIDVAAERFHDIETTDHKFERGAVSTPEFPSLDRAEEVVIDYAQRDWWLLGYFNPEVLSKSGDRTVARIRIDPGRALSRLLLRLGPDAVILEPEYLIDMRRSAAMQILDLYRRDIDM